MKAKTFSLTSLDSLDKAKAYLNEIIPNGKIKVVFSNAGTKSSKQRGLEWDWYTQVADAGIGGEHEDSKEGVHLVSKWRFGVRIRQRDDSFFADLYDGWCKRHKGDSGAIMWFIDQQVKTEQFDTAQMAEYLTEFQRYYIRKGVNLTDPEFRNLLKYEEKE